MPFDGSEGSPIDANTAGDWTHAYQASVPGDAAKAMFFGRDILESILAQDGCKGIRFYFGLSSGSVDLKGTMQLVAVGADHDENDQLGDGFIVADEATSCPSACSQPNVLYN